MCPKTLPTSWTCFSIVLLAVAPYVRRGEMFLFCRFMQLTLLCGGYQQHDAQELLCFLLDALHEDVNRAPYPFPPAADDENDGQKSEEARAREMWEQHRRPETGASNLGCAELLSSSIAATVQAQ